MAAAFFNLIADPNRAHAISVGTRPGDRVHPEVIEAMRELDVDLSSATPKGLTVELAAGATHLVTLGCGEQCVYIPGVKMEDWPLEDPKGQSIERVREIRDVVNGLVRKMIEANGWAASSGR